MVLADIKSSLSLLYVGLTDSDSTFHVLEIILTEADPEFVLIQLAHHVKGKTSSNNHQEGCNNEEYSSPLFEETALELKAPHIHILLTDPIEAGSGRKDGINLILERIDFARVLNNMGGVDAIILPFLCLLVIVFHSFLFHFIISYNKLLRAPFERWKLLREQNLLVVTSDEGLVDILENEEVILESIVVIFIVRLCFNQGHDVVVLIVLFNMFLDEFLHRCLELFKEFEYVQDQLLIKGLHYLCVLFFKYLEKLAM